MIDFMLQRIILFSLFLLPRLTMISGSDVIGMPTILDDGTKGTIFVNKNHLDNKTRHGCYVKDNSSKKFSKMFLGVSNKLDSHLNESVMINVTNTTCFISFINGKLPICKKRCSVGNFVIENEN